MEEDLYKTLELKLRVEFLKKVKEYACKLHDEVVNQKYDNYLPYSFHLNLVAKFVMKFMPDDITDDVKAGLIMAAYLHDSIEDARLTYNDVLELLSDEFKFVADIVYACTNERGKNRKERANDKFYEELRTTPYAPFVKACDRLANVFYSTEISTASRMKEVYKKEMDEFTEKIGLTEEIFRTTSDDPMVEATKKVIFAIDDLLEEE